MKHARRRHYTKGNGATAEVFLHPDAQFKHNEMYVVMRPYTTGCNVDEECDSPYWKTNDFKESKKGFKEEPYDYKFLL
jgi:hypothetical protein